MLGQAARLKPTPTGLLQGGGRHCSAWQIVLIFSSCQYQLIGRDVRRCLCRHSRLEGCINAMSPVPNGNDAKAISCDSVVTYSPLRYLNKTQAGPRNTSQRQQLTKKELQTTSSHASKQIVDDTIDSSAEYAPINLCCQMLTCFNLRGNDRQHPHQGHTGSQ